MVEQAKPYLPRMVEHRRHLHSRPEVGLELPETHRYLDSALESLGLEPESHAAGGVTVRIRGTARSGRVRILRADMDALPLEEKTALPYSSEFSGAMHACGHDLHMAMLLGAAEMFLSHPPRHDVVLAFQPGEESDRGALEVLKHQNLQLGDEASAFAIHVNAVLDSGAVAYRHGTFMVHGDWFKVNFSGAGGHASAPHLAGNPIEAAADFVLGLSAMVEKLGATEKLVATVTEFLSGNAVNVIPTVGTLRGTLRTDSLEQRKRLHEELRRVAAAAATARHVRHGVTIMEGYPAVVGDDSFIDAFVQALESQGLGPRLERMEEPSMVIEDFAYFLHKWPGAMVYLGAKVGSTPSFNHSNDVLFDENVMTTGLALHGVVADLDA
ncbi:M20 metallopeptidase family protein [Pseudarthrobacter sp. S9]|uniref:M20 metallopeptidase family protein n=1 Tax=Pseudarthrobacter sp. S9 TaxID=3418421 RepID=UPI003D02B217